ncbi:MAG: AAA family ATPase [Phycisphaerales bacterium]|jgi:MoxR-like ATPase
MAPEASAIVDSEAIERLRGECDAFRERISRLRASLGEVLVGQSRVVAEVLVALFADGHVLLEGPPGLGKTLLVRTLADAMRLDFGRVQFTPDLMPADITGTSVITDDGEGGRRRIEFRPGPIFTQLLLADEINRAAPRTQSALLEAMAERSVSVGGETRLLERPFLVLATQNPIEQEGTFPLPEAQLDRFLLKVHVPAPTRGELDEILSRTTSGRTSEATVVFDAASIREGQALARRVFLAPSIADYAARLVLATQPGGPYATEEIDRLVAVGSSPRGLIALVSTAKVAALLDGRYAVSGDDLRAMALPALRHRLVRSFEAESARRDADEIVRAVIAATPRAPEDPA